MILQFTSIHNQIRGLLSSMLSRRYADLIAADPIYWKEEERNWIQFDHDAFSNMESVGACVFLSRHDQEIIGFGSFDPRQRPAVGIVGHNCILPKYRGQGFGKQQIMEILRRFFSMGIKSARVTTNDNSFFIPAQRMYLSCGFKETGREACKNNPNQGLIHYQKKIGCPLL